MLKPRCAFPVQRHTPCKFRSTAAMQSPVSRAWSLKPRHLAGLALSALLLSPLANANPGGPDPRKIHRYDAKAPHADVPAGGARAAVIAPAGVVKGVVTDFKNYASIITRFDK